MKIISKSGREYDVVWVPFGWSYARPSVRVKKKFLLWEYHKEVWRENPYGATGITKANTAKRSWLTKWFEEAVEMYEDYERDWGRM